MVKYDDAKVRYKALGVKKAPFLANFTYEIFEQPPLLCLKKYNFGFYNGSLYSYYTQYIQDLFGYTNRRGHKSNFKKQPWN